MFEYVWYNEFDPADPVVFGEVKDPKVQAKIRQILNDYRKRKRQ